MQKKGTYRLWSARLLLVIFTAMWSLKMVHALVVHHQHADRPVCKAATDQRGVHFHDERYQVDDCSICAFVLAIPDVFSVSVLVDSDVQVPDTAQLMLYEARHGKTSFDTTSLRGPPAI